MPRFASRLCWVVLEVLQSTMEIARGARASEILVCRDRANVFDSNGKRFWGRGTFVPRFASRFLRSVFEVLHSTIKTVRG